ncbi:flagellar basal body rod protein FlgB [Hydrogenothermus marinus]|uniref:Flagellar basal body rod protein FlgB n=1 Tax=Hydrogenothermus marinus TaxID=133270 RepID=A0A3M0BJI5_9AQUI|nr:flagellar basal body rod protein FlgB [Hydrogenothermus marinus]RMA97490.1 flagellar basal-body rod protein FlgB [Hydrogenothermus marinus]
MSFLFNDLDKVSEKASYYLERTKIIQSNIANADTPNYKPKDLVFEKVLNEQIKLKKTDPKHISPEIKNETKLKVVEDGYYSGYDKNKVDVDHELAKLAESSIMYKTLIEIMKKDFGRLKYAIKGR